MKKIYLAMVGIIGILFLVGCSNGKVEQEDNNRYIQFTEPILLNNGDVNLNLSGILQSCSSISINTILCPSSWSGEECWEYKKESYIDNR